METDGGRWTVFQRRQDGSVDFSLYWSVYKNGFGNVSSEHWLGNDNIHRLSRNKTYELRIDLEDFDGQTRYATYSNFSIADEVAKYILSLGSYSGDAGDSMSFHAGYPFSTLDRNNEGAGGHCAGYYKGGWWYNRCLRANLNGQYLNGLTGTYSKGVVWVEWRGSKYSLKKTEMKLRDSMSFHAGYPFSTLDRNNDGAGGYCVRSYKGGWWYNKYLRANLNGQYLNVLTGTGVFWVEWRGSKYSLKKTEMKLRPT
eukprot:XP_011672460.1 PREDICTED: fibrinogen C domain-containing protein 1-like [Strongylocentrotus purpuratus]